MACSTLLYPFNIHIHNEEKNKEINKIREKTKKMLIKIKEENMKQKI